MGGGKAFAFFPAAAALARRPISSPKRRRAVLGVVDVWSEEPEPEAKMEGSGILRFLEGVLAGVGRPRVSVVSAAERDSTFLWG